MLVRVQLQYLYCISADDDIGEVVADPALPTEWSAVPLGEGSTWFWKGLFNLVFFFSEGIDGQKIRESFSPVKPPFTCNVTQTRTGNEMIKRWEEANLVLVLRLPAPRGVLLVRVQLRGQLVSSDSLHGGTHVLQSRLRT